MNFSRYTLLIMLWTNLSHFVTECLSPGSCNVRNYSSNTHAIALTYSFDLWFGGETAQALSRMSIKGTMPRVVKEKKELQRGESKHGEICTQKSDCVTMLFCVHDINNKLRCLCGKGQYINDEVECSPTSYLTVRDVGHKLISPTRLELRWSSDSVNKKSSLFKVMYGTVTVFGNGSGITLNNLTLFTDNVFKITVTLPNDSYYDDLSGSPTIHTINTNGSIQLTTIDKDSGTTASSSIADIATKETTNEAETNVSQTLALPIGVSASVIFLVVILLIIFYLHRRKHRHNNDINAITESNCKKDSSLLPGESVYNDIETSKGEDKQPPRESHSVRYVTNSQLVLAGECENQSSKTVTYSSIKKIKHKESTRTSIENKRNVTTYTNTDIAPDDMPDAEYSHLNHIKQTRSRDTENVYNG